MEEILKRSLSFPQIAEMEAEFIFVDNRGKNAPEDTRHCLLGSWPRGVVLHPALPGLCTPCLNLTGVYFIITNIVRTTYGYLLGNLGIGPKSHAYLYGAIYTG